MYGNADGATRNRVIAAEDTGGVWISEQDGAGWKSLPPFAGRNRTDVATLDSQYFIPGFLKQRSSGDFAWLDETAAAARTYSEFARSGLALPGIAPARLDAYVSAPNRLWDHLAGSLVVRNLGGVVRYIDSGDDYGVGPMTGGLVAARDSHTADRALKESCNDEMLKARTEPCAAQHLVKTSTESGNAIAPNRNRSRSSRSPA